MKPDRPDAFAATELNELVHGRVRLGILAYLAGAGDADFVSLSHHLKTTNGDRKSTRLNSSHTMTTRMPSSA